MLLVDAEAEADVVAEAISVRLPAVVLREREAEWFDEE
jgi:hypothetical protein